MKNDMKSLLWLRWHYLLGNKLFLLVMLIPLFAVSFFVRIEGSGSSLGFLGIVVQLIYGVTAGSFVAVSVAEEKEKRTLSLLILSGVSAGSYIFTVSLFPLLFAMAEASVVPIILHIEWNSWFPFLLVACFSSLVFIAINLLIGLYSQTTNQANVLTTVLYTLALIVPILARGVKWMDDLLSYSFLSANSHFFNSPRTFSPMDSSVGMLVIWLLLLWGAVFVSYKRQIRIGE